MLRRFKWRIVVWLVFLAASLAQGQDLESLAPVFLNKVATLRNFYGSDLLRYDSSGTLISRSEQGPWTIYGRLQIDRFAVHKNKLEIGASRLLVVYDQKGTTDYHYIRWQPNTLIEIDVAPNASVTDVKKALGRVFVSSSEKFSDLVPAYWRSFLGGADPNASLDTSALPRENATPVSAGASASAQDGTAVAPSPGPGQAPSSIPNKPTRIRVSQGVIACSLIKRVYPRYPPLAKLARVSGIVILRVTIKKNGSMGEIQIEHPTGAGMDEAAVEAVSQWKYQPYLLKGEPVEVQTQITVNFTLG